MDTAPSTSSQMPATSTAHDQSPQHGILRFPTMVHFIMASVVLTPLALIPYLPIRARLARLSRQVEGCNKALAVLRRDVLDKSHADDVIRLKAEVEELKRDMTVVRQQANSAVRELAAAREAMAASTAENESALRRALAQVAETRARSSIPPEVLGSMGDSFAAVANFVEEAEITFGLEARSGWDMDPRGISAMRQTALRLRGLRGPASSTMASTGTDGGRTKADE